MIDLSALPADIVAQVGNVKGDLQYDLEHTIGSEKSLLRLDDADGCVFYISAIKLLKEDLILLLTSTEENEAITVAELLQLLDPYDDGIDVLLQTAGKLRQVDSSECTSGFDYDAEEGFTRVNVCASALDKDKIYDVLKDKLLVSSMSNTDVTVVRTLPENPEVGKAYFDGIMLLDASDEEGAFEDDIQQMHGFTKDGKVHNLEDYYTDNGAFDEDGSERFLAALNELMTAEEYEAFIKAESELPLFDLKSLIHACNFPECTLYGVLPDDDDEYILDEEVARLMALEPDDVAYLKQTFRSVEWMFRFDETIPYYFAVKYYPEDDDVQFSYSNFGLKTRFTLINILKSQRQWKRVGYAFFDNDTDEVNIANWCSEEMSASDYWLDEWDKYCSECVKNSREARLFKATEEEFDEEVDILDLLVDTNNDY